MQTKPPVRGTERLSIAVPQLLVPVGGERELVKMPTGAGTVASLATCFALLCAVCAVIGMKWLE